MSTNKCTLIFVAVLVLFCPGLGGGCGCKTSPLWHVVGMLLSDLLAVWWCWNRRHYHIIILILDIIIQHLSIACVQYLNFSGACCILYSSCPFWYAKSIWTTNLSDKFCLSKFECHTISGCGGALINQAFQPKQTARPTLCEQSWRGNETQCLVMQKSYTINSCFWQEGTEFQRLMLSSLLEDLGYYELKISESHGTLYIMMCIYT